MATIRTNHETSEAAVFARLLSNGKEHLTPELARYLRGLGFSEEDKARMHDLAVRNQDGALSLEESCLNEPRPL